MATTTTKTKAKTTATARKPAARKTVAQGKQTAPSDNIDVVKKTEDPAPVVETPTPVVIEPRKFDSGDMIPCKSVRNGVLQYIGKKTGDLYEWSDYGDITDVSYGDLLAIKANKSKFIYAPWFLILDEDAIVALKLKDLYDQFAEYEDVDEFFDLPASEFRAKLMKAPQGFKDTVARTASLRVRDGSLDSVIKIKIIDDVLGKSIMSMLNNGGV